jgi:hypothetical protein
MKKYLLFPIILSFLLSNCFAQKIPVKKNGGIKVGTVTTGTVIKVSGGIVTNPATGNTNGIVQVAALNIPVGTTRVSIGIFNAAGNLIRTLYSGVNPADLGTFIQWDGLLDDGTPAPNGTYAVKTLTNNVQYTWEGVIGNTSSSLTDNIFKSYGGNTCFVFVGTRGFYGQFFYEGGTNSKYFNLSDIGRTYDINFGVHASTLDCATDGTNIYWAGQDQYQGNGLQNSQSNYIYASKVSDNTAVSFVNQASHNSGRENENYTHFIGLTTEVLNPYIGVAVNSNFIFATKAPNQLLVFNGLSKSNSGAIAQTLTYNNPGKLAAGSNNELWMVVNGALNKYNVNAVTGAITPAGISIAATNPVCVRISPDNATVLVIDAGTQQVKAYSNSTGVLQWTLGQAGGYDINGPAVANDRFMFDRVANASPAIAYQPDGSFWVNDIGNYRTLHFNADRTYKEQIMYMPSSRSTNADPNNPTRVFCDELEFQRDYTKPLDNGVNGSWRLVKNWKVGTTLDAFRKFTQVVTLSNGHTYATGDNNLYDLTTTGAVLLSSNFEGTNFKIEADGSLYTKYIENNSQTFRIGKQPLTRFASNYMPQWGNSTTVVTSPNVTATSPFSFNNNTRGSSTNSKYFFSFNPNSQSGFGEGYHLGAIKTGGNTWDWQTSKSTFFDYHGDYPRNGDYDIGNNDYGTQHSENCQALVQGADVFWNVNAEFWKGAYGVNIWNHFNEDGLLVGNFGVTGLEASLNGQFAMAGNSFSTALVKVGGDYYIYHCDESRHGGIHSWHVTGLNTISESNVATLVVTNTPINVIPEPTSLMNGLPYRSTNFTGGNGWSLSSGYSASTDIRTYLKNDPSISLAGNSYQSATRSFNNTSSLNSWNLSGQVCFAGTEPSFLPDNYNFLEVLDITGKVICRFYEGADGSYNRKLYINNNIIFQGPNLSTEFMKSSYNKFSMTYTNGAITMRLNNFTPVTVSSPVDIGADMTKPASLRVIHSGNQSHAMDLSKLKFVPNTSQTLAP